MCSWFLALIGHSAKFSIILVAQLTLEFII